MKGRIAAPVCAPARNDGEGVSFLAKKELTCVSFVIMPDGRTVPAEELTAEENAAWQRRMLQRLSENMSDYYTQHPEEYARL